MTTIGQLNRHLTLEAPADVGDGAGGTTVTWQQGNRVKERVTS